MNSDLARPDPSAAAVVSGVCISLLPFLGKPFHLDDPMYIWAAQQIVRHPLDFYGFTVNWVGSATPMAAVMQNPPLVSYYLACVGQVFGWSEIALHGALLVPAGLLTLGTYRLAARVTKRPGEAALIAASMPATLVSSTTVMCDVPMLCAWVWSLHFWMRGVSERAKLHLALGVILATVAALAKYFGIAVIPLLVLYAVQRERAAWRWAAWLLVPVAVLAAYQVLTEQAYGLGLLTDAGTNAREIRKVMGWSATPKFLTTLAFVGGSFATGLFYLPFLWSRRALLGLLCSVAGLVAMLVLMGAIGPHVLRGDSGVKWGEVVQLAVAMAIGASTLVLIPLDISRGRNPETVVFAAWGLGTFVFAFALNWAVNARSLLPLAPVCGIFMARTLDRKGSAGPLRERYSRYALVPAAALALLVAVADESLALSQREAALTLGRLTSQVRAVWFHGHWGFQHYAQQAGLMPIDYRYSLFEPGDLVVQPENTSNLIPFPNGSTQEMGEAEFAVLPWISTMNKAAGAGFYADVWGPLPYAFGAVPAERYRISRVLRPLGNP